MNARGKSSSKVLAALAALVTLLAVLFSQPPGKQPPPQTSQPTPSPAPSTVPSVAGGNLARVSKIVDGDTIHLLIRREGSAEAVKETVRLFGIDAPELHAKPGQARADFQVQPFAREARDLLAKLCPPGSDIVIVEKNRDRFGRLLGVLYLLDGRDLNKLLVESGFARAFVLRDNKRDPLLKEYTQAETAAKEAQRGQWAAR